MRQVKMTEKVEKPWGGRFSEETDKAVEAFTASLHFDRRLYRCDIEGSIAHARMLARQGIVKKNESRAIIAGLKEILRDIEDGTFFFNPDDEDIHMAIEKALIVRVGEVGGKLHSARSRNDQVALDERLYLRAETDELIHLVRALQGALIEQAKKETGVILPGYTHMQKAQPVLLSHYLLSFREMFDRDLSRLYDCRVRMNVMPLGAAALAGTGLPIDRKYVARLLKFPRVTENSMDTVSDRDFVAEFIFVASLIMAHLSRFCEDLVLWSTDEFGYIEIADSFTTGSSIMPQKKNPDVAELIRGKTGRVYGDLVAILTLLKGLPMTYNRDLQEDKEALFDALDTTKASLRIFTMMVGHIAFRREKMATGAEGGFSTATDIAEYLVRKGTPFREAHGIVGKIVAFCIKNKKKLTELTMTEFLDFYGGFDEDVFQCLAVKQSVGARQERGGTAGETVRARIAEIEGKDR
ncbi:MAG: argininosuccinate lyase [Syntrophobacterales bacterium]|nr:argininosuccinate lyase [Syntrophobacterales bacterium]